MKRRLYFLLPDVQHARSLIEELELYGVKRKFMHTTVGEKVDVNDFPITPVTSKLDWASRVERFLWGGNLALFFVALFVFIAMMFMQLQSFWLWLPVGLMLISFLMGVEFATQVPIAHVDEFQQALKHMEILLMIDVPIWQVAKVGKLVHRHHPEAIVGGVGWHLDGLHA